MLFFPLLFFHYWLFPYFLLPICWLTLFPCPVHSLWTRLLVHAPLPRYLRHVSVVHASSSRYPPRVPFAVCARTAHWSDDISAIYCVIYTICDLYDVLSSVTLVLDIASQYSQAVTHGLCSIQPVRTFHYSSDMVFFTHWPILHLLREWPPVALLLKPNISV